MSHIPPPCAARLLREMSLLSKDPPPGVAAFAPNPTDMTKIRAQITGPEGSPFEGGIFLLTVNVTGRYPFEPPRCRFLTPLYHPNIDSGGRICLDTLKTPPAGSWSPAVSLPSLLLSIRSLMAEPNPDDGLVPEISDLYKRNPKEWHKEAKKRTSVDATMQKLEEMESALDSRECSDSNSHSITNKTVVTLEQHEKSSEPEMSQAAVAKEGELSSVDVFERDSKRSKLSSRK